MTDAEKQALYVQQRSFQREALLHFLATRELPGSPVTKLHASPARVADPLLGEIPPEAFHG